MAGEVRQVLRNLLRSVDRNISSTTGTQRQRWRQYVLAQFRAHQQQQHDPQKQRELLQLAKDYGFLIDSVREHKVQILSLVDFPDCTAPNKCAPTFAHIPMSLTASRSCCSPTTLGLM
jgi:hypothetical protein